MLHFLLSDKEIVNVTGEEKDNIMRVLNNANHKYYQNQKQQIKFWPFELKTVPFFLSSFKKKHPT